jgi:hypothetical protein
MYATVDGSFTSVRVGKTVARFTAGLNDKNPLVFHLFSIVIEQLALEFDCLTCHRLSLGIHQSHV